MATHPLTPAGAARRKLLADRWVELLGDWGDRYPVEHAGALLAAMDELGFRLPAAIQDAPPPAGTSHDEHRRAVLAPVRAQLAARRTTGD